MGEHRREMALEPEKAVDLLGRLMLAWDGQWFLKVAESCGLEKAVELNAKVRTSFGRIEIREFMKARGIARLGSLDEAVALLEDYQTVFLRDGIEARWTREGDGVTVKVTRCRPQEGAGRAGLRPDTPCVACESIWGAWLEAALPGTKWRTRVRQSIGRGAGFCRIEVSDENAEC